jgi:hypothetical protein
MGHLPRFDRVPLTSGLAPALAYLKSVRSEQTILAADKKLDKLAIWNAIVRAMASQRYGANAVDRNDVIDLIELPRRLGCAGGVSCICVLC